MANSQIHTSSVNTPSIITIAGTALNANSNRLGWNIQNVGTNVVYVLLGSGASSSVYHFALKPGTANDDGLGASVGENSGVIYTGIITFAGTTPRITCLEKGF